MTTNAERVEVRVADDRMSAELLVHPTEEPPSLFHLRALLANQGVLFGLRDEFLHEAIKAPGTWVAVAFGKPAKEPVHGHVQHHFRVDRKPQVAIADDGRADLKELGLVENVAAGHLLATLVDPEEGEAGRLVSGEPIQVEAAHVGALKPGKNVTVSEDGRELHAAVNGRVIFDQSGTISVDDSYTIVGDVGPATGNIDFVGSVMIGGNVCSDFRVKASGRVVVAGHVEAAVIEAGQEIVVRGGVAGGKRAILQCPGDITVKHAQDARIMAGGVLRVKESLLRVSAMAAREIHVESGAIIGGSVSAPVIHAAALGSDAEARTVVEIGIAPRARLTVSRFETQFITTRGELLKLRQRLGPLQAQHSAGKIMASEDRTMMERLETACFELEKRLLVFAGEIAALVASPAACVDGELKVSGDTHPGVVLASVAMERPVRQIVRGLAVTAHEGKMAGGAEK